MRIAFDLDDTLIPSHSESFPVERPRRWLGRLLAEEHFRRGATDLLHALARHGCDIWAYTTSLRKPSYIKRLFRCYGVRLGGAINADLHRQWMLQQPLEYHCLKYPPAYGIDLLVDDSLTVCAEGQHFCFRVLHVRTDDDRWAEKVLDEVGAARPSLPAMR